MDRPRGWQTHWHRHPGVRSGDQLTVGERAADRMRGVMGSWPFVFGFFTVMILWAVANSIFYLGGSHGKHGFDPYPYILLNLFLSMLAGVQAAALLIARPYSERPPRFVYELSAAGQELAGALRLLAGWGARNAEGGTAPRHSVCGTQMEARWWCPTCERPVSDEEGEELHFA